MRAFLLTLLLVLFISAPNKKAVAELSVTSNPDRVDIGLLYHGSNLMLSGISEPGAELILKITSSDSPQIFREKDKVAGLFWMNGGKLIFERAPGLYLLYSTKKVNEILSDEGKVKHLIGYPALNNHADILPIRDNEEKNEIFQEFVKLKETSGLYSISDGKFITTVKNGKQVYNININWPYQAAPDDYTMTAYAVRDGKIIEKAEAKLRVQQVGIVKELTNMARNNGILYGLVSIMVAIAAGFGVGIIFRRVMASH